MLGPGPLSWQHTRASFQDAGPQDIIGHSSTGWYIRFRLRVVLGSAEEGDFITVTTKSVCVLVSASCGRQSGSPAGVEGTQAETGKMLWKLGQPRGGAAPASSGLSPAQPSSLAPSRGQVFSQATGLWASKQWVNGGNGKPWGFCHLTPFIELATPVQCPVPMRSAPMAVQQTMASASATPRALHKFV